MTLSWPTRDSEQCVVCGAGATEEHHLVYRSQGGEETRPLCRSCHNAIHQGRWVLDVSPERILVTARVTGEVIVETVYPPADFDQPQYVQVIQEGPEHLISMAEQVRFLDNDGLVSVAEAVSVHHTKAAWIYLTEVAYWMHRRMPRGEITEKTKAMAQAVGMGYRRMMDLLKIRQEWEMQSLAQSPLSEIEFFAIASQAQDPDAALAMITDEKLANPSYTTRQARRDVLGPQRWQDRFELLARQVNGITKEMESLCGEFEASEQTERINALLLESSNRLFGLQDKTSPEEK